MVEIIREEAPVRMNLSHNGKGEVSREVTIRAETPELALKLLKETWEELKKVN